MNPGGEKFANFMWKLTKFVLFRSLCQTYGKLCKIGYANVIE